MSFAEETPVPVTATSSSKITIIADLNIREAQVIAQIDNVFNLLFFLENGQGVQSGVQYGVQLIKETDKGQFMVDEYIFPELLAIPANSKIKKDVIYKAPENINGEYTLIVNAKNQSGLGLGIAYVGKVNLTAKTQTAEIVSDTCYLSVADEDPQTKYNLAQGVDIDPSEELVLNCMVVNSSDEEISITPVYETHYRNIYGEVVPQKGGDKRPIVIKAKENKEFSLILPKATKPQAYDVVVAFEFNDLLSNKITAHYVLRGLSATIQNFSIDKDSYKKDETALFTLNWSASADSFPGGRKTNTITTPKITLDLSVKDGSLRNCIKPINKVINENLKDGMVEIQAPVLSDCDNITATLALKDNNGSLLAAKALNFKTTNSEDEKDMPSSTTVIIIFGALIVVGGAVYFINKNKKVNENETKNEETI